MKVVFLDRDGIINEKALKHKYITKWDSFIFMKDIFKVLRYIQSFGYSIIIITNQQGIGKGLFSENDLKLIHLNMKKRMISERIDICKIYYCPHLYSDNCNCRKPKIGMFNQAVSDFPNIDVENSIMIGDSESDIIAGNKFGCKTILVSHYDFQSKANYKIKSISQIIDLFKRFDK